VLIAVGVDGEGRRQILAVPVTDDSGKSQRQIDNYPCYVPLNRGWSLRKSPNHVFGRAGLS
jgi:hypothetical protein